jgi:hypothetical protein
MLQAFVDDSASDSGDQRFFLCAYVNTAEKWADFSDSWQVAMHAPPPIEYLKMAEAQNLRGQFRGWSAADRDAKVLLLAKTIRRYRPWSVECSVSREEFRRILKPAAPYPLQNPYFGCFYGVIYSVARFHHANGVTVPTDFVFDEQGSVGVDAAMYYQWLKDDLGHDWVGLLGSTPVIRDDKLVLPLQAADMLAWHVRRDREGVDPPNSRPAMDFLLADGGHVIAEIDAATLASWAKKFRRVPGVQDTQSKASWRETKKATLAYLASGNRPPSTNLVRMYLARAGFGVGTIIGRVMRWWLRVVSYRLNIFCGRSSRPVRPSTKRGIVWRTRRSPGR